MTGALPREAGRKDHAQAVQIAQLPFYRMAPGQKIRFESLPFAVLDGMLEVGEGFVLGIEQSPVAVQKLVVDHVCEHHLCLYLHRSVRVSVGQVGMEATGAGP